MAASVEELDRTVKAFYESRGDTQKQAQNAMNQFKENPDAWLMVDKILQEAQYPQTKCKSRHAPLLPVYTDGTVDLGLQVLDNVVMTRWKVLPREQCQGTLRPEPETRAI